MLHMQHLVQMYLQSMLASTNLLEAYIQVHSSSRMPMVYITRDIVLILCSESLSMFSTMQTPKTKDQLQMWNGQTKERLSVPLAMAQSIPRGKTKRRYFVQQHSRVSDQSADTFKIWTPFLGKWKMCIRGSWGGGMIWRSDSGQIEVANFKIW